MSSRIAFPLLEEMDYIPPMKFGRLRDHGILSKNGEKFGFYDKCLFHTTVRKPNGMKPRDVGLLPRTGDAMRAKAVV